MASFWPSEFFQCYGQWRLTLKFKRCNHFSEKFNEESVWPTWTCGEICKEMFLSREKFQIMQIASEMTGFHTWTFLNMTAFSMKLKLQSSLSWCLRKWNSFMSKEKKNRAAPDFVHQELIKSLYCCCLLIAAISCDWQVMAVPSCQHAHQQGREDMNNIMINYNKHCNIP